MPLQLQIRSQQGICRVVRASAPEELLAETALAELPAIDDLYKNPYQLGKVLFAALGGERMREQLDKQVERYNDNILLLECDEESQAVAWEYASSNGQFLACEFAMLRLVPRNPMPVRAGPPRLLVLCADPLIYPDGENEPAYRLDFKAELQALNEVFQENDCALQGRQIPPTAEKLFAALQEGPALLHLSCHGSTIPFQSDLGSSQNAILQLEDETGQLKKLLGNDLRIRPPRGSLRMVLLSACQSAPIARALAQQGVPIVLGMQHNFPDPLSDKLAAKFYRSLINGYDIAEASRHARGNLADRNPGAAGMLVVYSCQNAWHPLELPKGTARFVQGLAGDCRLPKSMLAGNGELIGRDRALAELTMLFNKDTTAVTITGTGGIGKTSLALAFIQRFGWRFGRVLGVSFAAAEVITLAQVCHDLLEQLRPGISWPNIQVDKFKQSIEYQQTMLDTNNREQETTKLLHEKLLLAIQPNDLVFFDNYESVLNPSKDNKSGAEDIQRLLPLLINRQARLLLTSRDSPAGLEGEKLFPSRDGLLGLQPEAATKLFEQHSNRSRDEIVEFHREMINKIVEEIQGHPLAIILLASAYDTHAKNDEEFLKGWPESLATINKPGLNEHHRTIAVAIERSVTTLEPSKQTRLLALSHYQIPFLPAAAALLWGLPCDDEGMPTKAALAEARVDLELFVQRSLLQLYDYDDRIYQFQPVIRQELYRRLENQENPPAYYRYGFWLAKQTYLQISHSEKLARLVHQSLPLLDTAIDKLQGNDQQKYISYVITLYLHYGRLEEARKLIQRVIKEKGEEAPEEFHYKLVQINIMQGIDNNNLDNFPSIAEHKLFESLKQDNMTLQNMINIFRAQGQNEIVNQINKQLINMSNYIGLLSKKYETHSN
jgi:hypothetical protein